MEQSKTIQSTEIKGRIQVKMIALTTRCGIEHRVVIESLVQSGPANAFALNDLPLVEAALKQAADWLEAARQVEWFLRNPSCGNC